MPGPRSGHLLDCGTISEGIGDRYAAPAFQPPRATERSPLRGQPDFSHSLSSWWCHGYCKT